MHGRHLLSVIILAIPLAFVSAGAVAATSPAAESSDSVANRLTDVDVAFGPGGATAASALIPFLRDADVGVRIHASRRLVEIGVSATEALVDGLADEKIRWLAGGVIVEIGNDSVPGMVKGLAHKDPAVRRSIVFILRQMEAKSAEGDIRKLLVLDSDVGVQVQAIHAVARFGSQDAVELLRSRAEDSPSPEVRDASIEALAFFGDAAFPALSSFATYGIPEKRAAAVKALGILGTDEAMRKVVRALTDPSPVVRHFACAAIGAKGNAFFLPELISRFSDADGDVREAAAEAAAKFPTAPAVLQNALRRGTPAERAGAATALRKAGHRPSLPLLRDALSDPAPEVRIAAVAALMSMPDAASVDALLDALQDKALRWIAMAGLRQFGDLNLPALLRRTGNPEYDAWKQKILEGMEDRVLDGCLETLANSTDVPTKVATICTMQQIRDARAAVPLIALLADEKLCDVACFVLGRMGEAAYEPLLFALTDENPARRSRAVRALGDMGDVRAYSKVREFLTDDDLTVRLAAQGAVRRLALVGTGGGAAPGFFSDPAVSPIP